MRPGEPRPRGRGGEAESEPQSQREHRGGKTQSGFRNELCPSRCVSSLCVLCGSVVRARFRFAWRLVRFLITLLEQPGGTIMRAYSVDLRRRVIDDCDAGVGTEAVAA